MGLCRQCDICKDIIPFEQGVDKAKKLTISDDNKTYKNLDVCEECYRLLNNYIEKLSRKFSVSICKNVLNERGESMSGTQKDT